MRTSLHIVLAASLFAAFTSFAATPSVVRVEGAPDSWRLTVNGKPFTITGADGDALEYVWTLLQEAATYAVADTGLAMPAGFKDAIVGGQGTPRVKVILPGGGVYRLFCYVFWARGYLGDEKVSFHMGGIGDDRPYPDSGKAGCNDLVLSDEWKRYRIDLEGVDLSCIKTGFGFSFGGQGSVKTFFLDDIEYVAE